MYSNDDFAFNLLVKLFSAISAVCVAVQCFRALFKLRDKANAMGEVRCRDCDHTGPANWMAGYLCCSECRSKKIRRVKSATHAVAPSNH